jgi:SAM-dependent methyltransferase
VLTKPEMPNSEEIADWHDSVSRVYDLAYTREVDRMEDALHQRVFARWIHPETFVLDVGCGTGHALRMMEPRPRYYVGVDLSLGMLREAKQRHPEVGFYHADITEGLPWTAHDFDVVVASYAVLNYVEDLANVVSTLSQAAPTIIASIGSPALARRRRLSGSSPGQVFHSLDTVRAAFEASYGRVRITGFSSRLHDWGMLPGVRFPKRLAYYWLVEATQGDDSF